MMTMTKKGHHFLSYRIEWHQP